MLNARIGTVEPVSSASVVTSRDRQAPLGVAGRALCGASGGEQETAGFEVDREVDVLLGVACPRATLPKIRTRRSWCRAAIARICSMLTQHRPHSRGRDNVGHGT